MADIKPMTPLLADELTEVERVQLSGLRLHPGYPVLEKLFMSACKKANDRVIQLDPEEEGYERKLKARQAQARDRNEFSLLVLQSIEWHIQAVAPSVAKESHKEQEQNRITKVPTRNT